MSVIASRASDHAGARSARLGARAAAVVDWAGMGSLGYPENRGVTARAAVTGPGNAAGARCAVHAVGYAP